MLFRSFLILIIFLSISCTKEDIKYSKTNKVDPYIVYQEGLEAFEKKDYFFASKKFDEAELNFSNPSLAAKSSIMSSYALYGINFYNQAEENLKRYFVFRQNCYHWFKVFFIVLPLFRAFFINFASNLSK